MFKFTHNSANGLLFHLCAMIDIDHGMTLSMPPKRPDKTLFSFIILMNLNPLNARTLFCLKWLVVLGRTKIFKSLIMGLTITEAIVFYTTPGNYAKSTSHSLHLA